MRDTCSSKEGKVVLARRRKARGRGFESRCQQHIFFSHQMLSFIIYLYVEIIFFSNGDNMSANVVETSAQHQFCRQRSNLVDIGKTKVCPRPNSQLQRSAKICIKVEAKPR